MSILSRLWGKPRFWIRFLTAIGRKYQKLIIFCFLIGAFSFWFLPKISPFILKKSPLKIGLVGKFTVRQLPLSIQQLIGQGLTSVSKDGQVKPLLAQSWQTKNGGREYIFTLKDNLFWNDGTPLVAKDINYHFSDVATTNLGNKKVKFQLKQPFSPFPSIVSRPVFKKGLIGTGEYRVSSIKTNGQIVEKLVLTSTKNKIIFRFYPTEEVLKTAFKLGEVNIIKDISQPGNLTKWKNVKTEKEVKQDEFTAIFFNTQNPKFAEKSVRQALAYALKKNWPNRALTPINPWSWAFNAGVKKYEFNLAKARQLLEKTGQNQSRLKQIELITVPSLFPVAEEIKQDWQALGITTQIKALTNLDEGFEVLLISQKVAADPDQYLLWHSTQKTNLSRYKSPKLDKLLEEGREIADIEKRKQIYQDFQRFLVEDTPAIFLFHPTLYTLSRI